MYTFIIELMADVSDDEEAMELARKMKEAMELEANFEGVSEMLKPDVKVYRIIE